MRTLLIKIAIIIFCFWHMFAVAIYSWPLDAHDPLSMMVQEKLRPRVTSYLFVTSQWQQWNLFSPDPLRRVTSYVLETRKTDTDEWKQFAVINRQTTAWSALSREMKLLGNLEGNKGYAPVRNALLQTYCRLLKLPTGTQLRLFNETYVLPQPPAPESLQFWQNYHPEHTMTPDTTITCNVLSFQ